LRTYLPALNLNTAGKKNPLFMQTIIERWHVYPKGYPRESPV